MEQNTQQIEESKLPIKTKIVAWWIRLLGIAALIIGAYFLIGEVKFITQCIAYCDYSKIIFYFIFTILCVLLPLFISQSLFRKKDGAWKWSLALLILCAISSIFGCLAALMSCGLTMACGSGYVTILLIFLPLIILSIAIPIILFLDRKNFWKVAE
jgi:hypothetical protein